MILGIIGDDITWFCLSCVSARTIAARLNATTIVLIPKNKRSETVIDFRPISLCNVLLNNMSKMLANRLKKVLNLVILESQSTFLPRKLISDNIMVAYDRVKCEFLHFMLMSLGYAAA